MYIANSRGRPTYPAGACSLCGRPCVRRCAYKRGTTPELGTAIVNLCLDVAARGATLWWIGYVNTKSKIPADTSREGGLLTGSSWSGVSSWYRRPLILRPPRGGSSAGNLPCSTMGPLVKRRSFAGEFARLYGMFFSVVQYIFRYSIKCVISRKASGARRIPNVDTDAHRIPAIPTYRGRYLNHVAYFPRLHCNTGGLSEHCCANLLKPEVLAPFQERGLSPTVSTPYGNAGINPTRV